MKKYLFILLLFIGCEKDETFCWKCRRDIFVPGAHYSVVLDLCNLSERQIEQFEKDNTSISGTQTISMKCWKEGDKPRQK